MLFPPEIINDTTESLFVKRTVHSKAIYLVVVLAVAAAIAALPFIYVQISTQARGIIRTPNENNALQTVVSGEITEIRIAENMEVTRGDTLLTLNAQAVQEQIHRKEEKITENQQFIFDIGKLLAQKSDNLSTSKYMTENSYFRSAINEQQTSINYLQKEYQTSKSLYELNVTPQTEYLQRKNAYDAAVSQMANIKEQFRNRWEAEKTNYEIEIRELQSSIKQLEEEKTKYVLKAPESGSIIQFSGAQQGSFIAPGQTIGYISNDSNLLVECYVLPVDIGYIQEKQQVAFQLDAFNYNQWGLAHGIVKKISKDIVIVNEQPVFLVRCSLETSFLKLKNGYTGKLKKGMMVTGRFYLTDRSLWQLLFDKVDNWVNPKLKE
ncbi:MAG: HlyD family secretion protein [Dysgonamonadaceae bacterium]|jgi:HlyD family secretion protein|nr:HlyD family secretion protein [Dysgonamonadaceae bacterium]